MCATHITTVLTRISRTNVGKEADKRIYLSTDFSKAFDRVVREILFNILDEIPDLNATEQASIHILRLLYKDRKMAFG